MSYCGPNEQKMLIRLSRSVAEKVEGPLSNVHHLPSASMIDCDFTFSHMDYATGKRGHQVLALLWPVYDISM